MYILMSTVCNCVTSSHYLNRSKTMGILASKASLSFQSTQLLPTLDLEEFGSNFQEENCSAAPNSRTSWSEWGL